MRKQGTRHTCTDEPGEVHRGRELGGPRPAGYEGTEESTRNVAALGLGQNLSYVEAGWGTGTSEVFCGMVQGPSWSSGS